MNARTPEGHQNYAFGLSFLMGKNHLHCIIFYRCSPTLIDLQIILTNSK